MPLSAAAVAVLRKAAGLRSGEAWPAALPLEALVFQGARGGALSDATLSAVMKRMHQAQLDQGGTGYVDPQSGGAAVPHGLRSTFRGWAGKAGYPRELAEEALAHSVGSEVERAYAREHLAERRVPMMEAWAAFLSGTRPDGA